MALPGEYYKVVDCVVYISSVANTRKHSRKIECLESFAQGVRAAGYSVRVDYEYQYTPSPLAVMLGWATTNTGGRNITLRKQIIAEQRVHGYHTMCIDASCWKYVDNNGTYLRYSLGGPFYDRAEYANRNSDSTKWQQISQDLQVKLQSPTNNNGHILIGMQRDGGFAMKTLDPMSWLNDKIQQIRKVSQREIRIRPHPGQYNMADFARFDGKAARGLGTTVIHPEHSHLLDDLQDAHAAVFFNSSASVAAVCAGIPVFVDDSSCVSWTVANKNIANIETPETFDRTQWIWDLASAHWSDQEAKDGSIYKKFLPYLV